LPDGNFHKSLPITPTVAGTYELVSANVGDSEAYLFSSVANPPQTLSAFKLQSDLFSASGNVSTSPNLPRQKEQRQESQAAQQEQHTQQLSQTTQQTQQESQTTPEQQATQQEQHTQQEQQATQQTQQESQATPAQKSRPLPHICSPFLMSAPAPSQQRQQIMNGGGGGSSSSSSPPSSSWFPLELSRRHIASDLEEQERCKKAGGSVEVLEKTPGV
jgi:hypothetical protein